MVGADELGPALDVATGDELVLEVGVEREHPPAHAVAGVDHRDVVPDAPELIRGGKPRESRTDDHHTLPALSRATQPTPHAHGRTREQQPGPDAQSGLQHLTAGELVRAVAELTIERAEEGSGHGGFSLLVGGTLRHDACATGAGCVF